MKRVSEFDSIVIRTQKNVSLSKVIHCRSYKTMALAPKDENGRLNLNEPKWLQDTFKGRAKHFFTVTDPRNLFASSTKLEEAKHLVQLYRLGEFR